MSSEIILGPATLLPLKEATEYVPYSRDYVARLARDGKVVATQIDRVWYVDVSSLQNFYTNSSLEDSVRSRHLSLIRKRDLEVKQMYQSRLDVIARKHQQVARVAAVRTSCVVALGLAIGVLMYHSNQLAEQTPLDVLAAVESARLPVPLSSTLDRNLATVHTVLPAVTDGMYQADTVLNLAGGIVVVPALEPGTAGLVADFFSDPVTVDMVTETSGTISPLSADTLSSTSVSLPFVRVPTEARVVPADNVQVQ